MFSTSGQQVGCWQDEQGTTCEAVGFTGDTDEFVKAVWPGDPSDCDGHPSPCGFDFHGPTIKPDGSLGGWFQLNVSSPWDEWAFPYVVGQVRNPPGVVPDGQTVNFGTAACLSATDSATCWDINTHHGFQISQAALVYW